MFDCVSLIPLDCLPVKARMIKHQRSPGLFLEKFIRQIPGCTEDEILNVSDSTGER